jgi:HTH-type transcriptional regulator/antitoxin HigA
VKAPHDAFIDDLDVDDDDQREREADRVASEALIPRAIWRRSSAFHERTPEAIITLANKLKIHPAIVAGRLRNETRNFYQFGQLVGHRQVRVMFDETIGSSYDG